MPDLLNTVMGFCTYLESSLYAKSGAVLCGELISELGLLYEGDFSSSPPSNLSDFDKRSFEIEFVSSFSLNGDFFLSLYKVVLLNSALGVNP